MKLALTFLLILMILPLMTGMKKSGDHERRSVKSMRDVFRDHRDCSSDCVPHCPNRNECCDGDVCTYNSSLEKWFCIGCGSGGGE
nr:conotoxin precursor I1 [Conus ebraeus]UMA83068.1 conotoxin precursor I1 [Conus judaeus]DAZ86409.1 TPA_inf: conotoxin precursor I1 [Conus judaeus]DAZ86690.1 TPA_inf: conotoxin precursor I1 [Conus judaeus]